MHRPVSVAVLVLSTLIPRVDAQEPVAGSGGEPAFVLPLRIPSLAPSPVPALAPGGRLGARVPPVLVAAAWARRVHGTLPFGERSLAVGAAASSLLVPVEPGAAALGQGAAPATGAATWFANLGMDLSLRFELKADQFRNLRCDNFERQQAVSGCSAGFPTISPNPQYAIRSGGVVGQRLHVNVDFDSQREFDANNNIQVWYEGLEDEILKRVEAGNVSFQVPQSRFISAAIPTNNFGVQAIAQVGALELRGIYAQQKGNVVRDRIYTVGETTTQALDRGFRDLDYEQGRFFFTVDPTAVPGYPAVDILSLASSALPDSLRVTSLQVYRVRSLTLSGTTNQNIGGIRAVACGPGASAVDCSGERAGPFQWELLQEGKDYYVDPSGAWFALINRLDPNDYLAVSYIPFGVPDCRSGGCVGTFPQAANPDTAASDTLRLVYDPRPGVTAGSPAFRFEIRSVYRLGGHELDRASVQLTLAVNQRERPEGSTDPYLARLGLALANDPNTFDQYNRLFPRDRDPLQGASLRDYYVVFPHLTPFADSTKLVAGERNDSLYRTPRDPARAAGASLGVHADAPRGCIGGRRQGFPVPLELPDPRGEREALPRKHTLDPGRRLHHRLHRGSRDLQEPRFPVRLGPGQCARPVRGARRLRQCRHLDLRHGGALRPRRRPGRCSSRGCSSGSRRRSPGPSWASSRRPGFIGGVSTNLRFQPTWLTSAVNVLPGRKSDAPSFVTVSGEVAVSQPRPNPLGQAYVEEFEADAGRFISLNENAWHWGSVPSSARGATAFGISPAGFDTVDAVPLTWQSLPLDFAGRPIQFLPQQIDTTIRLVGQVQSSEPVLWLMLKPDTMMGLADSRTGVPNWRRPGVGNNARNATRWRSITQTLSLTGVDLTRVEYLEFWVWEDNRRTARASRAAVLFDFGSVFEDALAFVPDSFTATLGGDTTYYGGRVAGQGRLDSERDPITHAWNAATNDEGILGDRVVDGITNATDARAARDPAALQRHRGGPAGELRLR